MLTECASCIQLHARLPLHFWAEEVSTAAFLINRSPSVLLDFKILEEVWCGNDVKYSYLRVFGCVSYVHISDQARGKLDLKSLKCTFTGYGGDEFGFRFQNDKNRKIIKSKDVIFNENVLYKGRKQAQPTEVVARDPKYGLDDIEIDVDERNGIGQEKIDTLEQGTMQIPILAPTKTTKKPKPNPKYTKTLSYLLLTDGDKPKCYDEVTQVTDASQQELAIQDEMKPFISNGTWELAKLPKEKK